jgi:hypothetical protein
MQQKKATVPVLAVADCLFHNACSFKVLFPSTLISYFGFSFVD